MVLVFILIGIIILAYLILTVFLLSTLQIDIENLKIGNKEKINENNIKDEYEIKITVKFLNRIPILWLKLNNKKIRKISNSKQLEKIDLKSMKQNIRFDKKTLKTIKEVIKSIKIKILELNLRIDLGTEDAILTSYLVAFIASILGIILPHIIEKNKINNCKYIVNPIYQNRNEYHVSLDSIISIKIVHIIYSMLIFLKKGRDKNERSSNRRTYAYRYE